MRSVAQDQTPSQPSHSAPIPWPQDARCPLCGGSALPFDVRVSALFDWIAVLEDTTKDLKKAAERLAS